MFLHNIRNFSVIIMIFLLNPYNVLAATKPKGLSSKVVEAKFVSSPPKIDGSLDDKCWKDVKPISDFIQIYPKKGALPTEKTEIYLLYDNNNLYISFRVHYSNPKSVVSTIRQRDEDIGRDDCIIIFLDPLYTRKDCYILLVNPFGTQQDGIAINNGGSVSSDWDGRWESVTQNIQDGWTGEVKIPWLTIGFSGKNKKIGINFIRKIHSEKEVLSWVNTGSNSFNVSKFGILNGIHIKSPRSYFFFTPYINYENQDNKRKIAEGLNIDYKITPNLSFTSVFNPDYAQIEADVDQIDLSKTVISLPEKRPFFTEGREILQTPISLVYTRKISEIEEGGKVLYRSNAYKTFIFGTHSGNANYGCIRFQKNNVFKSSSIGLLATATKEGIDVNYSGGTDMYIQFPKNINFRFQIAQTSDKNFDIKDKGAIYASFKRREETKGIGFGFEYANYQPSFNPEMGLLWRPDLRYRYGDIYYIIPVNAYKIRNISTKIEYGKCNDYNKKLLEDGYESSNKISFSNNLNISFSYEKYTQWYEEKYYHNRLIDISLGYYPGGTQHISFDYESGDYFGGKMDYPALSLEITPASYFSFSTSVDYQHITYSKNESEKTLIYVLKENWNITKKLSFRTFLQWTDVSKEFQTNFLLAYDFFVGSHIYLVWNEIRDVSEFNYENRNLNLPLTNRKFFLKLCYNFKL